VGVGMRGMTGGRVAERGGELAPTGRLRCVRVIRVVGC
jgi:hypothetical protein